jgi:HlyD family secretion protein
VERDEIESLSDLSMIPGMPAEVMIVTGQRTALRYALEPILPSIRRSFRED